MSDELREKIEQAASGPKRVRTDAGEVETHDLSKLIEADKYLAAARAASTKRQGLRITRLLPPGAY